MEQVKFYYCKTALPETLVEGGIYFLEPTKKIYRVTDGTAIDFTGMSDAEEETIAAALNDLNNRLLAQEGLERSDWSENDETSSSYIENRTHYTYIDSEGTEIYVQLDDEYLKPIEKVEIEHGHYETTISEEEIWLNIEFVEEI